MILFDVTKSELCDQRAVNALIVDGPNILGCLNEVMYTSINMDELKFC